MGNSRNVFTVNYVDELVTNNQTQGGKLIWLSPSLLIVIVLLFAIVLSNWRRYTPSSTFAWYQARHTCFTTCTLFLANAQMFSFRRQPYFFWQRLLLSESSGSGVSVQYAPPYRSHFVILAVGCTYQEYWDQHHIHGPRCKLLYVCEPISWTE